MALAVLVPSKGRPDNAARLAESIANTRGSELTALVFAIDPDEPHEQEYRQVLRELAAPWISLVSVQSSPQRIGPILNILSQGIAAVHTHIGFLGDDHLPRTPLWDEELVRALEGRPGVAYGNDLLQGANLPTAGVISSDIINTLGYLVPVGLEHLYLDDFWKMLGQAVNNLVYRDEVIIEHLHPTASKSMYDATYQEANSPEQYSRDQQCFQEFINNRWPAELSRLKERLNLD